MIIAQGYDGGFGPGVGGALLERQVSGGSAIIGSEVKERGATIHAPKPVRGKLSFWTPGKISSTTITLEYGVRETRLSPDSRQENKAYSSTLHECIAIDARYLWFLMQLEPNSRSRNWLVFACMGGKWMHSRAGTYPYPPIASNVTRGCGWGGKGWLSCAGNDQGDIGGNGGSDGISAPGGFMDYRYDKRGGVDAPEGHAEILQHLYPPGSGYETHRNRIPHAVDKTCAWVTRHAKYQEWLGNKTSGLLWLSADPGCGKSVLASFLVNHLKIRTNAIVCYFFFKDDDEEQRSATFALRAILHQLFRQRNSLSAYAKEAFEAKDKGYIREVETLWDILVKAVAEGECGDVICVVDALDECAEEALAPLIRHITHLRGSQTSRIPLKFFVTSRPSQKLETELGPYATTITAKGEEEAAAISTDLTLVIADGVRRLESYWGQSGRLGYVRELLGAPPDRTFLWVFLVLELLKSSDDGTVEVFTDTVSTAPCDMAEFYTKILDRSTNPDQARRILNIALAATRPLTLGEMDVAFRIDREHKTIKDLPELPIGFEGLLKDVCGILFRIVDSKIFLVHQTAREFLIKGSSPGEGNWQYTLCPKDSNFTLADICISYLSLEEFGNNSFVTDPDSHEREVRERREKVARYREKHYLLGYAATHWAAHFRDSQDRQTELFERAQLICQPRSNRLRTWFAIFAQNSGESPGLTDTLTRLVMESQPGEPGVLDRLLEDGGDVGARAMQYGIAPNASDARSDDNETGVRPGEGINTEGEGKECTMNIDELGLGVPAQASLALWCSQRC
ncbi:hypothetical protein C7212DRAFT_341038 [Tuber magnatum]|uniref:NACHT domain-containing protein n=1 Tax=Tuber magnatum TaxID=42249 RepID=A0A317T2J6_9PEZI|nr:hypothetical protein C7212DRAFT_341038 [Tuber magnatum]